jgi:hypothetical protein
MEGPSSGTFDVLVELEAIRSWARTHDAVPVRSGNETSVPVGFAPRTDAERRIDWNRFQVVFEQLQLALVVKSADFAFVGRHRIRHGTEEPSLAAGERG